MEQNKFNIGILVDSLQIHAWAFRMLQQLQNTECTNSVVIYVISEKKSINDMETNFFKYGFYQLYRKLENLKFKTFPDAFELKDLMTLYMDCKVHYLDFISDQNSEVDRSRLETDKLDILINLSRSNLPEDIYYLARYGVWQYYHADDKILKGGPFGFWELFDNHSVMGCSLKVYRSNSENELTIAKSYASIEQVSVNRNLNFNYWKSASFLSREIKKMSREGPEQYFNTITKRMSPEEFSISPSYSIPNNIQFIPAFIKRSLRYLRFKYHDIMHLDQWMLMYALGKNASRDLKSYKYIIPPKDRFWADPFIVSENNKYYVFFEEALYSNPEKAHISLLVMNENGEAEKPQKILERDYHLSYPFVFKHDGQYWMIPETAANRTIEVYRCTNFPDKWELYDTLMTDIEAYDVTLFYHDHKWWLFTVVVENQGSPTWDELFLFHSDSPFSKSWIAHPQNPIVSDVRNARPAGKLFQINNCIYRPSQNSARRYGYGMKINKIVQLNEENYEEITIDSIKPQFNQKIMGLHTLNFEGQLTIMDGIYRRLKFPS